jgi:hypothetical protein
MGITATVDANPPLATTHITSALPPPAPMSDSEMESVTRSDRGWAEQWRKGLRTPVVEW